MKKIKLYDYQQKMLEDIINVLTTAVFGTFYNENGKKEKVGCSVMVNWWSKCSRRWTDSVWTMGRRKWS